MAAYRIVVEALTNAVRHSGSNRARVRLFGEGGAILLEVVDGGAAGDGRWRSGVGTASMRERAAELGGTLTAGPTSSGGSVRARLPLVTVGRG